MIKKFNRFLENKIDFSYKLLTNDESKDWFKNLTPINFNDYDLVKIKKNLDFELKTSSFNSEHSYNYIMLKTGVIYSLRRDYYLICLGNVTKTKNYTCKGLDNLLLFINDKLSK